MQKNEITTNAGMAFQTCTCVLSTEDFYTTGPHVSAMLSCHLLFKGTLDGCSQGVLTRDRLLFQRLLGKYISGSRIACLTGPLLPWLGSFGTSDFVKSCQRFAPAPVHGDG